MCVERLRKIIIFMPVSVFPVDVYICVPCVCPVPIEARRGLQFIWNWSYQWLLDTMWVLRLRPGSLEEEEVILTPESSF